VNAKAFAVSVILPFAHAAQQSPDPVIEVARKAAASYRQSLPDYIVKRTTTRGMSAVAFSKQLDTVTADVAFEHGKEVYANIRLNGNSVKELPSGGSWSTGEFATRMLGILAPERAAVFTHQHAESTRNRPSYRYDFAINQAHSAWRLSAANVGNATIPVSYSPAYTGRIRVDRDTGQAVGD
jgi:hypothetical protein